MAIFDWKCECGNVWEEITLPGDAYPKECPKCKDDHITKCMGASTAVFIGNGFPTWDNKVKNSIIEMQKQHKNKSYLKTHDGKTTANDSSDNKRIQKALAGRSEDAPSPTILRDRR
ncbi:MAG: hypothetical protein QGH27_00980 [SAR324 cluster bacterium]|jgi:hypothetical protein|nr:hypothetical protein [SAR324 cluster bacterium]